MTRRRYVVPAIAALVVAACGSGGGATSPTATEGVTVAATTTSPAAAETITVAQASSVTFYVIGHGIPGPQWSIFQDGARQAGKDLGVTVFYEASAGDATLQSQMIEAAIAKHPAAIAISLPNPTALSTAAEDVVAAKIPLYMFNSGINEYKAVGAETFVGENEVAAGAEAGERLSALGATSALCGRAAEDNLSVVQRCEGFAKTFKGTVRTEVIGDETDHPGLEANLTALLRANPDIDAILGVTPNVTNAAVSVARVAGRKVVVGGFDLLPELLDHIREGTLAFTVDQQLYLQGYLPVVLMYLHATNLNTAGGGLPILTGPVFIDKDNVDQISALVDNGTH
jgi:simple sugar transport system substrate-binding protein